MFSDIQSDVTNYTDGSSALPYMVMAFQSNGTYIGARIIGFDDTSLNQYIVNFTEENPPKYPWPVVTSRLTSLGCHESRATRKEGARRQAPRDYRHEGPGLIYRRPVSDTRYRTKSYQQNLNTGPPGG